MNKDTAAALQRADDEITIEQARQTLADAEATDLVGMDRVDIGERAIRLEVTLRKVLDVIDRMEPTS